MNALTFLTRAVDTRLRAGWPSLAALLAPLFKNLTLSYSDATVFESGKTAADLKVGVALEVKGSVTAGVMSVGRIEFADAPPAPVPGITVFETEGIASHVTKTGNVISSFDIDGITFAITTESAVRTLDGELVDGAKIHVLFKRVAASNVVLLVNTKH